MAIYLWKCQKCGVTVEVDRKFDESDIPPNAPCPVCNDYPWVKIPAKTSFALKGDGWYKDGYQKKQTKEK